MDLRIELVDHLTELVLVQQSKNPRLSFKDAFFAVYKSFGIFGFIDIAAKHENQMQKRYWLEIWDYFKTWFTPPKVFLTATISVGLYFLFDAFEALMHRMIGNDDGIIDGLFSFTRPVTGSYFWCPPVTDGKLDLSAVLDA